MRKASLWGIGLVLPIACNASTLATPPTNAAPDGSDAEGIIVFTQRDADGLNVDSTISLGYGSDASDGALPAPPEQACDADASDDGGVCAPPPSVCADAHTLVYYDNGQCTSGRCAWQARQVVCGLGCASPSCVPAPCPATEPLAFCRIAPTL